MVRELERMSSGVFEDRERVVMTERSVQLEML